MNPQPPREQHVRLNLRPVGERSGQDNPNLDASVALFRMGRFLERIADHGVNIAENVVFMVNGNFPDED